MKMNIKIIGDSIALGVGCSNLTSTDYLLFKDGDINYYRRFGSNTWSSLLSNRLSNMNIINNGIGGIDSGFLFKHLCDVIDSDDDIILCLIGLNDRKNINGMDNLKMNLNNIIDYVYSLGKEIIFLTPSISTGVNENYSNRLYHTLDVCDVIRSICRDRNIKLIDIYYELEKYYIDNDILVDDIMYEEGCRNDGLHPTNRVQSIMASIVYDYLVNII